MKKYSKQQDCHVESMFKLSNKAVKKRDFLKMNNL